MCIITFLECRFLEGNIQAIKQITGKRTPASKASAQPVQPREGVLPFRVRKCEIRNLDLQRPGAVGSQHGVSQFVHPRTHQTALELEDDLVGSSGGDS